MAGSRRVPPMAALSAAAAVLAAGAVVASSRGAYVGDNRFEQYWNPGRRLARTLVTWDGTRGLGRVPEDVWPGATLPLAAFRAIGLPAPVAQAVWHALLLTIAAAGAAAVVRLVRPRVGVEHAVTAIVYGAGPFAATFLVPSNLFLHYALAPWLLVACWHGVHSTRPWRAAAAFALVVFAVGNTDLPGLAFALTPLAPALLWIVLVERSATSRAVALWAVRAGLLATVVMTPALVKSALGAATLSQRLNDTELPRNVAATSSWSETWRGLGFWLTYYREGAALARPHLTAYLTSAVVVVATFAVPVAATAALARDRSRARVLFGGLVGTGLIVMVGAYPPGDPSPLGRLILRGFADIEGAAGFRTTYKAGAALLLGLGALAGLAVVDLGRVVRSRRARASPAARIGLAVLGLGVAVSAFPFWTGHLYDPAKRTHGVPGYWDAATRWLDDQPGAGRVLVLPGSSRTTYRWGWVGDDLLDARLDRAHVVDTAIPLATPESANLVHALDRALTSGGYVPSTFAPIARRLGIELVLVRNDLDWQRMRSARPARLQPLRADPDLHLVASFGAPGEHTTAPDDPSLDAAAERRLPPVEIYAVDGSSPVARASAPTTPLIVAGDGGAWPDLITAGVLGDRPVRYAPDLSRRELHDALADGAPVVVTDTNRRRVSVVGAIGADESHTLPAGRDLERRAQDLFQGAGTQSVATFGDADAVTATGPSRALTGYQPWTRPARATDGDPRTAWLSPSFGSPVGRALHIELARPAAVDSASVVRAAQPGNGWAIVRAFLRFSDGSVVPLPLASGRATVRFPARTTSSVDVIIGGVEGGRPRPVGFAEVQIPGLDLREAIQLPDGLFRRADADPGIATRLASAPVAYLFRRVTGTGPIPEEHVLRRRFRVREARPFLLRATVVGSVDDGCHDDIVTIDGRPIAVRRDHDPRAGRFAGFGRTAVVGCATARLAAGWHLLESSPGWAIDRALLANERTAAPSSGGEPPGVQVLASSPTHWRLRVDAPRGAFVTAGQAFDHRWRATFEGEPLGEPVAIDTLSSWQVPGPGVVDIRFAPQRPFTAALLLGGLGLGVSLLLVAWRPGRAAVARPRPPERLPATRRRWPRAIALGALTTGAFAVAGPAGAIVAAAAVLAFDRVGTRPIALTAVVLLVVAAAATVLEDPLGSAAVRSGFASRRPAANAAAMMAGVLTLAAVIGDSVSLRRGRTAHAGEELGVDGAGVGHELRQRV